MKLKLLLAVIVLSLTACSGSDDTTTNDPAPVNPVEKELDKITVYDADDIKTRETIFQENRPVLLYIDYFGNWQLVSAYTYFENGLMKSSVHYDSDGTTTDYNLYYDEQDRLVQMHLHSFPDIWEIDFVYNDDGTISRLSDGEVIKTFHVNDDGRVVKIAEEDPETYNELIFVGGNMVGVNLVTPWSSTTRAYEYDLDTPAKGHYLDFYKLQFDTMANAVLFNEMSVYTENYSENYITKASSDISPDVFRSIEYEFDEDGYPIEKKEYYGGTLIYTTVIKYKD